MKESKLMKEVVKRSVQPDLDAISSRILDEHEDKAEVRVATVRSHYLSAAVACVGLVFIAGLVLGLLIMRGAMKPDFRPNTAPEIIDSNSSVPDYSTPEIIIPDDSNVTNSYDPYAVIYLQVDNSQYFSYIGDYPANIHTIGHYENTAEMLRFLSDQEFIGFVDNSGNSTYSYLTSNWFNYTVAVFRDREKDAYYLYAENGTYVFGTKEPLDLNNEGISLTQPEPAVPIDEDEEPMRIRYNGIEFSYHSYEAQYESFPNQQAMVWSDSMKKALEGTVFLGFTVSHDARKVNVVSNYLDNYCAVFYNPDKNRTVVISLKENSQPSMVIYEPSEDKTEAFSLS